MNKIEFPAGRSTSVSLDRDPGESVSSGELGQLAVELGLGELFRVLSRFLNRRPKNVNWRLQSRPARGEHEARRAEPLGGSGGMPPQKIFTFYVCRDAISCILGPKLLHLDYWIYLTKITPS